LFDVPIDSIRRRRYIRAATKSWHHRGIGGAAVITTFLAQAGQIVPEQVTTNSLAQNIVYASGTLGALVILAGLLLVDIGGVRRVNVFDTVIQKLIAFFIGFVD
jgi:hypothetical protein